MVRLEVDNMNEEEIEETMKDLVYQQVDWRYEKVIAWQPLPEPYKGGREE